MRVDDKVIKRRAAIYSEQLNAIARTASKEEDIRIASERELAFLQQEAGIKLEGKHEFTVASGRIDSVYERVIIEYKNPNSPAAKLGPRADSPGTLKVVSQIKSRFADLHSELGYAPKSLFGVGLDGKYFVFVRFRDDKWSVLDPVPVTPNSTERFLWALFNLGIGGKPFSPEELARDFGSESLMARSGVRGLYEVLLESSHPKVNMLFAQWRILFGEVCGYDVELPSDALKALATTYELQTDEVRPAQLLFALHTYYALFMKLLAAEIVASFHPTPTPLRKILQSSTSAKLKRELEDLEAGSVFRYLSITNFLEGDLFSWYTSAWCEPIEELVRAIASTLDNYNPGTILENPTESQDLLKNLYQKLFPRSLRHALGEYYTPDWLADHVMDRVKYRGNPDQRVLDPACGSGTFLLAAIKKIRNSYDAQRELRGYDEGELCRKILDNVIGFDLNPLAVMAARTNILIAIRDLIGQVDRIELPVYLCDSIMTPSVHGGLFVGNIEKARELKTAAGSFLVPVEVAESKESVSRYAEILELCINDKYSAEEFIQRCKDDSLKMVEIELHTKLFLQIARLTEENRNGIWARIIKNSFAPLFVQKVDFVVGNPPWINWRHLPAGYRREMESLWTQYQLLTQKGLRARLGAGMDDISVLMTYVCADTYLKKKGSLGFVITQTLFQSAGGGQGFRRLRLPDGTFLKINKVDDFTQFQPFDGASNRTATFCITKMDAPTSYPVVYTRFSVPKGRNRPPVSDVKQLISEEFEAIPISADPTSAWSVTVPGTATGMPKMAGKSSYQARVGIHSGGASGIFWINVLQTKKNVALISNCHDVGRNQFPSVTASVETGLIRPLIRGRDVGRWKFHTSLNILLPYHDDDGAKAISESSLRRDLPKTFSYFNGFAESLIDRAHYRAHFEATGQPYWSLYNVGPYTFTPYQVLWREQSRCFGCVVLDRENAGGAVANHKLSTTACGSLDEAHFLAAVLNSSPATFFIQSYVISVQISTHIYTYLAIPRFNSQISAHMTLARLSKTCHDAALTGSPDVIATSMGEIDSLVASFWGLSENELATMQRHVVTDLTEDEDDADPEAE